jgi:hypothetical protein
MFDVGLDISEVLWYFIFSAIILSIFWVGPVYETSIKLESLLGLDFLFG